MYKSRLNWNTEFSVVADAQIFSTAYAQAVGKLRYNTSNQKNMEALGKIGAIAASYSQLGPNAKSYSVRTYYFDTEEDKTKFIIRYM